MLDDATASWWYEQDGQQAGPVTAAGIARLVAEGRLGPAHRVWRDGMAGWEPLGSVRELAEAVAARPPPAPPPLGARAPAAPPPGPTTPVPAGPGATTWAPPAGTVAAPALEQVSVATVLLLSIVTVGIYGLVKFHQTGKAYEALAGRASTFSRNFWLFVGLGVAGFVLHHPAIAFPLAIASIVFQVLTLNDALALRGEAVRRAGVRPQLTPDSTHRALFISGVLLAWALVGVVLLLVQGARWFSDWNAVVAAVSPPGAAGPAYRPPAR